MTRSLTWVVSPDEASFDPRYFRKEEMQDHATEGTAGAKKIGAYSNDLTHSSSVNVQDVLEDLDAAIGVAMSGGEVNTGSNVNTAGIGVFDAKTAYDLGFKGIKSSDSHITVSDSTGDKTINIESDATSNAGSSTIVSRDGSGNFSANNITADLIGNADTASQLETSRNFQITGDGTASIVSFNGSDNVTLNLTVDKVDGKDVDDTKISTDYLWTAGKVISYITGKLNGLDWQESVKSKTLAVAPSNPSAGDRYIVASGASGVWIGQDNNIAEWSGTVWNYITPDEGTATWIEDLDVNYTWNGSSWVTFGSTQDHGGLASLQGGNTGEYYHLTSYQHSELTDGGDTTLHRHDGRYFTESECNANFLGKTANAASASKLATARTISLAGDASGSISFDGSANKTLTVAVANDSHTHSFDNLSSKTSGTGNYSTNGDLQSGRGSGGVALTINDSYGNANITFNHSHGVPEQTGNAARIEVNTDATSGAYFDFGLKSNATVGVAADVTSIFKFTETNATFLGHTMWHAGNDGSGSGLDADKLDGVQPSEASTVSTIVKRSSSGDINARLFRSEYDGTNSTINFVMTQIDTASNNYIRPSTLTQLSSSMGLKNTATTTYTVSTSSPSGGVDGDTWYQV